MSPKSDSSISKAQRKAIKEATLFPPVNPFFSHNNWTGFIGFYFESSLQGTPNHVPFFSIWLTVEKKVKSRDGFLVWAWFIWSCLELELLRIGMFSLLKALDLSVDWESVLLLLHWLISGIWAGHVKHHVIAVKLFDFIPVWGIFSWKFELVPLHDCSACVSGLWYAHKRQSLHVWGNKGIGLSTTLEMVEALYNKFIKLLFILLLNESIYR